MHVFFWRLLMRVQIVTLLVDNRLPDSITLPIVTSLLGRRDGKGMHKSFQSRNAFHHQPEDYLIDGKP
jgi:hypothetical protein